jgi:hypothetical protein
VRGWSRKAEETRGGTARSLLMGRVGQERLVNNLSALGINVGETGLASSIMEHLGSASPGALRVQEEDGEV